jgi:hypothetical protein
MSFTVHTYKLILNKYKTLTYFYLKLCKRLSQKKFKNQVQDALNKFEANGGKEVVSIIKTKIPTYNSF